jgi:hypothetical protein
LQARDDATSSTLRAGFKEKRGMETFWIISSAVVVSLLGAIVRNRKSAPRNLGYVSRDWVMRHGVDHTGA